MTGKAFAELLVCRRGTGILPVFMGVSSTGILPVFMGVSSTGILPVFMGGTPMPRGACKNTVKVAGETRI
jgi:hypothetical protein